MKNKCWLACLVAGAAHLAIPSASAEAFRAVMAEGGDVYARARGEHAGGLEREAGRPMLRLAALEPAPRQAATEESTSYARWWVGAAAGRSRVDRASILRLIDSGVVETSAAAYELYAGYRFHRHFGVQIAYADLGTTRYEGFAGGTPITEGRREVSGVDASILAILPLGESFSLFAKGGMFFWRAEARDIAGGTPFSSERSGRDPSVGVGVSYRLTRALALRAQAENFTVGQHRARLFSAGIGYGF